MRSCGEVHVADGAAREHQTCEHLGEVVRGDAVAVARVEDNALQSVSIAILEGEGEHSRKEQ